MTNLFRYYFCIIFIVGFSLCSDVHRHRWFLCFGVSDFIYKVWNDDMHSSQTYDYSVSVGYNRIDLNEVRSGWGFNIPLNEIRIPSDKYSNNFVRINLISFINKPIIGKNSFKFNTGFKSFFNFGGAYNNITLGPTLGISIKGVFLEYFRGYMDLVDFSLYTDKVSLGVSIKGKNND